TVNLGNSGRICPTRRGAPVNRPVPVTLDVSVHVLLLFSVPVLQQAGLQHEQERGVFWRRRGGGEQDSRMSSRTDGLMGLCCVTSDNRSVES
ncbi:hypothetical protein F7725_003222, partial [Dissostichus mawsoni]